MFTKLWSFFITTITVSQETSQQAPSSLQFPQANLKLLVHLFHTPSPTSNQPDNMLFIRSCFCISSLIFLLYLGLHCLNDPFHDILTVSPLANSESSQKLRVPVNERPLFPNQHGRKLLGYSGLVKVLTVTALKTIVAVVIILVLALLACLGLCCCLRKRNFPMPSTNAYHAGQNSNSPTASRDP